MPWDVTWPKDSVAFVRVTPRSDTELETEETCNAITYVYEDREVTIWESCEFDHPGQDEEDEIARNRIIWERLNPAADWFYCHMDGRRIEARTTLEHRSRVLIGLRDKVDPEWWHKAMKEMKHQEFTQSKVTSDTDPELAQPERLAPSRLDQHGATAQVEGEKDVHPDPDANSIITQGKSVSCTADESLRSELEMLRSSAPNTLRAIITFKRQSVQMFFSPENAIAYFQRKVKELWNIPKKNYYLLFNGSHESKTPKAWPEVTAIQVKIKGLKGGGRTGTLTLIIDGEECRCKTNRSFRQAAEDRDLEIRSDFLISIEDGVFIYIDDKIGDHFEAGSSVPLDWDVPDEDEEEIDESDPCKDAIKLSFRLYDEWQEMIIGKGHTMRPFMSDNWEEIEWSDFRFQGKPLDPDTHLLNLTNEQLEISVEIRTQTELDQEEEYEEGLAQWKAHEEEEIGDLGNGSLHNDKVNQGNLVTKGNRNKDMESSSSISTVNHPNHAVNIDLQKSTTEGSNSGKRTPESDYSKREQRAQSESGPQPVSSQSHEWGQSNLEETILMNKSCARKTLGRTKESVMKETLNQKGALDTMSLLSTSQTLGDSKMETPRPTISGPEMDWITSFWWKIDELYMECAMVSMSTYLLWREQSRMWAVLTNNPNEWEKASPDITFQGKELLNLTMTDQESPTKCAAFRSENLPLIIQACLGEVTET
jgi:hypothetical protein